MGRKQLNPELSQPQLVKEIIRLQDRQSRRVTILTTVSALLVVAAMAVLTATLWFPVLQITGESMAPLLQNGHVVITQRTQELQRGDLAAFYHENRILVKRVIADSGDWVDIDDDGNVSVNGEMLDEEYLQKAVLKPSNLSYPYQVPEGCFFVMGDNRAISMDSRLSQIGPISRDQILGKLLFRIWPLRKLEYLG